jgi:hypothetical protein
VLEAVVVVVQHEREDDEDQRRAYGCAYMHTPRLHNPYSDRYTRTLVCNDV